MKLTITVAAATDASFNTVFKTLGDAARNAQKRIEQDEKQSAKQSKQTLDQKLEAQKQHYKALQNANTSRLKAEVDQERDAANRKSKESITAAERTAREVGRIREREAQNAARQAAGRQLNPIRSMLFGGGGGHGGGGGGMDGGNMPYRMGYWASRNFSPVTPMLSMAHRMGSDLMRGAGINMDFGGMLQSGIELQKSSVQLSNQGFQENKVGTGSSRGERVDSGQLQKEFQATAKQYGFDPNEVARAATKFVDLTGDLKGARAAMGDLAQLSNATSSDLTDMASAAGSVSVQLERAMGNDMQGRTKALGSIMRIFAGQGKEGAVEIKDFAAQMAKVATITNRFGGDRESIFSMVGVLAQESRKAGGSASASQAATSVSRFAQYVGSKNGSKEFAKMGVNVFTDDSKRFLRNPKEIILEALSHTEGNSVKMGSLFKNVMAGRAIAGFTDVYNTARGKGGSNQQGLDAVIEEFGNLEKATMTAAEVEKDNAKVMETTAKKAQVFQDQLQEMVSSLATKVMPEVEKLGPMVLRMVDAMASLTGWLAENPLRAIPIALGVAITKAGIEQTLRVGIENIMKTAMNFGSNGSGLGGMGMVGNAAAALTIAALAATALYVGTAYVDEWFNESQGNQKRNVAVQMEAENVMSQAKRELKETGSITPGTLSAEKLAQKEIEKQMEREKKEADSWMEKVMQGLGGDAAKASAKMHEQKMVQLQEENNRLLRAIAGGGVPMVEFTGKNPSPVPPGARSNWVEQ